MSNPSAPTSASASVQACDPKTEFAIRWFGLNPKDPLPPAMQDAVQARARRVSDKELLMMQVIKESKGPYVRVPLPIAQHVRATSPSPKVGKQQCDVNKFKQNMQRDLKALLQQELRTREVMERRATKEASFRERIKDLEERLKEKRDRASERMRRSQDNRSRAVAQLTQQAEEAAQQIAQRTAEKTKRQDELRQAIRDRLDAQAKRHTEQTVAASHRAASNRKSDAEAKIASLKQSCTRAINARLSRTVSRGQWTAVGQKRTQHFKLVVSTAGRLKTADTEDREAKRKALMATQQEANDRYKAHMEAIALAKAKDAQAAKEKLERHRKQAADDVEQLARQLKERADQTAARLIQASKARAATAVANRGESSRAVVAHERLVVQRRSICRTAEGFRKNIQLAKIAIENVRADQSITTELNDKVRQMSEKKRLVRIDSMRTQVEKLKRADAKTLSSAFGLALPPSSSLQARPASASSLTP